MTKEVYQLQSRYVRCILKGKKIYAWEDICECKFSLDDMKSFMLRHKIKLSKEIRLLKVTTTVEVIDV